MPFQSDTGQSELYQVNQLQRMNLNAADGRVGPIEEIFVDDHDWAVRYLLIDEAEQPNHSGKLLVPTLAVDEVEESGGTIWVQLTRDQIANSPAFSHDQGLSRQYETEFYRYYRWPRYWQSAVGNGSGVQTLINNADLEQYRVAAEGEVFGTICGLVVDVRHWRLRYLEVVRHPEQASRILISPEWIASLDRARSRIEVNLTRGLMDSAPAYDPRYPLDADYERRLLAHYGKPRSWGG